MAKSGGGEIMDIYTKVFFINWIFYLFCMGVDRLAFDDYFEQRSWVGIRFLVGLWSIVSFVSIPVWLSYFIWLVL